MARKLSTIHQSISIDLTFNGSFFFNLNINNEDKMMYNVADNKWPLSSLKAYSF